MPRPVDLQPAWIAARLAEWEPHAHRYPRAIRRHAAEAYLAGSWLGEQLAALGCAPDQIERLKFAHGQMAAQFGDPWELSERVLAETRAGQPPEPGLALAEKLTEEAGLAGNLAGLLDYFLGRGYTPEDMERMMDPFRAAPRYPKPVELAGPFAPLFVELYAQARCSDAQIEAAVALYGRLWEARRAPLR